MALHLRGVVLPGGVERDLFIVGGRLSFDEPMGDEVTTIADRGFILPGLVDLHAHLEMASPAGEDAPAGERSRASAAAHLDAGVLTVREPGGVERSSTGIGPALGLPRVFTAGRFLSTPGGYLPGWAREIGDDELPDAAVSELGHSGAWVKVVGDWMADGRHAPTFGGEALAEAARRVHAAGGRLAMHATHQTAIERAIEAGFDSIEHGLTARREHLTELARRGIALVPTMIAVRTRPDRLRERAEAAGVDEASVDASVHAVLRHSVMVAEALEEGVRVLAGTDAAVGPHGRVREEIAALRAAGMAATDALAAGSWDARHFLGLPGIEEGAPADLAVFSSDPRDDVAALDTPALVVLNGRLVA